jgi:FlaA1/EpsC-like NDP-sugar epimerase
VLKAGGVGGNGSLYLLDMGEPVKIKDLAEQMIRFYGFEPQEDIKIEYTGLRPGERLDEELWWENEEPRPTPFDRILKVERKTGNERDVGAIMERLKPVCRFDPLQAEKYRNGDLLREILRESIPSYARNAPSPVHA